MKKIIIASDKYKGCLTSMDVAIAIERGIHSVFPLCEVIKFPVADGGDGTLHVFVEGTKGIFQTVEVFNPLMEPIQAQYGILGDGKTAVIELSLASGLALVPAEKQNPMLTTTYGTGQLISDALMRGCTDFIVGIGGSATNDAGTGILQALGYKFLDENEEILGYGGQILDKICSIDISGRNPLLDKAKFKVACDVDNYFSGKDGAAYVYAPQKGANEEMVEMLDSGLKHFELIIKQIFNKDIGHIQGAGAAGGVGGSLAAFFNATLQPGIDLVLKYLQFDELLKDADWIITGEGRIDRQTTMGKVIKGVTAIAEKCKVPVLALTGNIENFQSTNDMGACSVFSIVPRPMSLENAMNPENTKENLYQTTRQLFLLLSKTTRNHE